MNLSLWVHNLAAYSLQIAMLVIVGSALPAALRLRMPKVMLAYHQTLLAVCLLLPLLQPWRHVTLASLTQAVMETTEITIPADRVPLREPRLRLPDSFPLYQSIAVIFLAGVLTRSLWLAAALRRLTGYRRRASLLLPLPPTVSDMQSRLGVHARICVSDEVDGPVTFGVLDPVILFPARFVELESSFQRGIACHELLHVRRADWLLTVVEEGIRSLFWFHPAIAWLIKRIQLSREQAVDRQVLDITGTQRAYIQSLVHMAKTRGRAEILPAPLFLKEHQLTQRVALMLKEISMSRHRLIISLVVISVLLFITGQTAIRSFPLTTEAARNAIPGQRFIAGDVYDQAGALIAGATVRLIDKDSGQVLESTVSDSSGHFEVKRPDQGKLILRVEHPGFKPSVYDQALLPQENMKVMLAVGQIVETVKVRPDVPLVKSSVSGPASKPSSASLEEKLSHQDLKKVRVNGEVQAAKLIKKVEPVYPKEAKQAGISGAVILQITVDAGGDVSEVKPISGHKLLLDAAVEAVRQWKYNPTLLNGEPVPIIATVTINFELTEGKNGLRLTMDDAGNLLEGGERLEGERLNARIAETEGSIRITPNPKVPLKVTEETLQVLRRLAGERPLRLSAPYIFRDGHLTVVEPIRVGGNVQASKLVNKVSPVYPQKAKEEGVEGAVVLQITVNERGEVSDIQVVSGHELLSEAAVEAVKQWRYSPTLLNGEPVPVVATVTVQFTLK